MEFGVRELIQFGTLLASLAGAFAVVKSQLSRVIQDIAEMEKVLNDINTRIDQADADRAVIKHQNKIFGTILSPAKLEAQHREISEIKTEMKVVHKNLDNLYSMHNGKHPNVN
jgi:chaperonin cofactor prefoldin|tara:strand:- start:202 stop:540 length:339 start_codon:yes stop_codon:yes gene_type:complete